MAVAVTGVRRPSPKAHPEPHDDEHETEDVASCERGDDTWDHQHHGAYPQCDPHGVKPSPLAPIQTERKAALTTLGGLAAHPANPSFVVWTARCHWSTI